MGRSCSIACGIFPDQGLNLCLPLWQADTLSLSHPGKPWDSPLAPAAHQSKAPVSLRNTSIHHSIIPHSKRAGFTWGPWTYCPGDSCSPPRMLQAHHWSPAPVQLAWRSTLEAMTLYSVCGKASPVACTWLKQRHHHSRYKRGCWLPALFCCLFAVFWGVWPIAHKNCCHPGLCESAH